MLDGSGLNGGDILDTLPPDPVPPLEPGAISGRVWNDADGNRAYDGAEVGLGGVIVYSDLNLNGFLDFTEPVTITEFDDPVTDFDEGGLYTLDNLQPGWHNVRQVIPAGFEQTFPSLLPGYLPPPWGDASVHVTFVEEGQAVDGIDFGNQRIAASSISGVKWNDVNGNGVRDSDEPGVPGVVIYSDLNFNQVLDADEPSTVTMADDPVTDFDEGGTYSLVVEPRLHVVREVIPDGFRQTFPSFDHPTPFPSPLLRPSFPGEELAHFVPVSAGESVDGVDFGNQRIRPGSISGVKWNDANGNAERDPDEPGLAGVTIYVDLNDNGVLDSSEPRTVTTADIPETDFDEGGRYRFDGLEAGNYVIREIVPAGFRQTFPVIGGPIDPAGGVPSDFATVEPSRLDLPAGDVVIEPVSITVNPNLFVPIQIDVFASPEEPSIVNLSGPQLNGGGGDTSTFEIMVSPTGSNYVGELQFVELAGQTVIASIPLTIGVLPPADGAHRVTLRAGDIVEGLDFGNQRIEPATGIVTGRKWLDADGNREQGPSEPGLAGVTIYADLNQNGVLDADEPSTVTMEDIPETDFDEAGLYQLELEAGDHWIAEVIPDGFEQTFPANPVIAIFPPPPGGGVHFVTVEPGQTTDGLDFGNRRVENGSVSGTKWHDLNGNGERDPNEPGLAGVTIYADYNFNGQLDVGEPSTVTIYDPREIFPNDTGSYELEVRPGFMAIREVVPVGYFQTFPISDATSPLEQGAHFVGVEPGVNVPDLDFGNQALDNFPAGVGGRKWEDSNANGVWDADERGLGGVTIYVDTNFNGVFDADEPSAVTMDDIPETDFDESGLYSIGNLQAGFNVIREVVPNGYVQTFPVSIAASPAESGAHLVSLAPGEHVDDLNFGNLRFGIPLPGDFNGDGTVDQADLELWQESYGSGAPRASGEFSEPMHGRDYLVWQQNLGRTTVAPPASEGANTLGDAATSDPLPTGLLRELFRPATREETVAFDAAFAGETVSTGTSAATVLASVGSSTRTQPTRGAIAPRAEYAAIAAAIDAALEDEFEN